MILGRPDEGVRQMERALELDPLNGLYRALYAGVLMWNRRYDDAIAQARLALRTTPANPVPYCVLWRAYSFKAMHKEALSAAEGCNRSYANTEINRALEQGFAEGGYAIAMRRAAEVLVAAALPGCAGPRQPALRPALSGFGAPHESAEIGCRNSPADAIGWSHRFPFPPLSAFEQSWSHSDAEVLPPAWPNQCLPLFAVACRKIVLVVNVLLEFSSAVAQPPPEERMLRPSAPADWRGLCQTCCRTANTDCACSARALALPPLPS
jgi:hypothetical protein